MKFLSAIPRRKLKGVAVLRLDFNTEDAWRMEAALPTIKFLTQISQAVVILSHRGRPDGVSKKLSLKKDAAILSGLLRRRVGFFSKFNFKNIRREISCAPSGSVFVLENLRFLPGEERNDPTLSKKLASLGDFYVNEAFSVSHRANASVVGITNFLPSYAGLLMENEVKNLRRVLNPQKPLVVILGGAKAYDKLGVIERFKSRAWKFILGGAAANTILALRGQKLDGSLKDTNPAHLKALRFVICLKNLELPIDFRKKSAVVLDIGPESSKKFSAIIGKAKTIIWNGPMGLFEKKMFAKGSIAVANAIQKNKKAFSLVGGGETVSFLKKYKLTKAFDFVSTGGGAMLNFLAGKKLPGIEALKKEHRLSNL